MPLTIGDAIRIRPVRWIERDPEGSLIE